MAATATRQASAVAATGVAALHLFYAASGGIADPAGLRWLLALLTVVGAVLWWAAAVRGPWGLAWAGMVLQAFPAALSWPAIGVSAGGLLALALLLVALLLLAAASLPPRRAAPA